MKHCSDENLIRYAEGTLSDKAELEAHLSQCGGCRTKAEDLREMLGAIRQGSLCPEADDLIAYAEKGSSSSESIKAHINLCDDCRELVEALQESAEAFAEEAAQEERQAKILPFYRRKSFQAMLAAAAAVALIIGLFNPVMMNVMMPADRTPAQQKATVKSKTDFFYSKEQSAIPAEPPSTGESKTEEAPARPAPSPEKAPKPAETPRQTAAAPTKSAAAQQTETFASQQNAEAARPQKSRSAEREETAAPTAPAPSRAVRTPAPPALGAAPQTKAGHGRSGYREENRQSGPGAPVSPVQSDRESLSAQPALPETEVPATPAADNEITRAESATPAFDAAPGVSAAPKEQPPVSPRKWSSVTKGASNAQFRENRTASDKAEAETATGTQQGFKDAGRAKDASNAQLRESRIASEKAETAAVTQQGIKDVCRRVLAENDRYEITVKEREITVKTSAESTLRLRLAEELERELNLKNRGYRLRIIFSL